MAKKISNAEINKAVSAALRKKANDQPRLDIEAPFCFDEKKYKLKFTRRYHRGRVSLCIPASCNAGDDCCHLRKVNGIELCYTLSDEFDLLKHKGEGIIIDDIDERTENRLFEAVRRILDLISKQALKEK